MLNLFFKSDTTCNLLNCRFKIHNIKHILYMSRYQHYSIDICRLVCVCGCASILLSFNLKHRHTIETNRQQRTHISMAPRDLSVSVQYVTVLIVGCLNNVIVWHCVNVRWFGGGVRLWKAFFFALTVLYVKISD